MTSTSRSTFVVKPVRQRSFSFRYRFSLGYFEQALQLSAKYRRHEKFVKIQIENLKQFQSALDYIEKLKFDDAIEVFRTYGKTLMKEEPKGTTQLLKQLKPTPQQISEQNLPESLINLFINHPDELLEYLDFAVNVSFSLIFSLKTSVCLFFSGIFERTFTIDGLRHEFRTSFTKTQSN